MALIEDQVQFLISQLESHKEDYHWLSNALLELSALLYNLGEEMAKSRLLEEQTMLGYFNIIPADGSKKMTATEVVTRTRVDTNDRYFRMETNYKSVLEIIMTIKKKLDNQSQQLKAGL